jgi:hypothetical protein
MTFGSVLYMNCIESLFFKEFENIVFFFIICSSLSFIILFLSISITVSAPDPEKSFFSRNSLFLQQISIVASNFLLILPALGLVFFNSNNIYFQYYYNIALFNKFLSLNFIFVSNKIIFFINSKIMSFFCSSFNFSIFIGTVWPPIGSIVLDTSPLLNTLILLISGMPVIRAYSAIKLPRKKLNCLVLIISGKISGLELELHLLENSRKLFFISYVTLFFVYSVYNAPQAHCESEVVLKIIKKMSERVHVDHHLLLNRPVLILPETAYFPKGFLALTRSNYLQAQLLGGKTLTGELVNQYISLLVYSNEDNLFEFQDLGSGFKCKHLYDNKFLEIYRKYECTKTVDKQSFLLLDPLKSVRWNLNSNAHK